MVVLQVIVSKCLFCSIRTCLWSRWFLGRAVDSFLAGVSVLS